MNAASEIRIADPSASALCWIYWPVLLGGALFVCLVAWYLGAVDADLRPALKALLTGGVVAVVLSRVESGSWVWVNEVPAFVTGVGLLGFVWYLLGTFAVPMFVILFAVPVFAASLVPDRWLGHGVAALSVAAATLAAVMSSPALRWYGEQLGIFPRWVPFAAVDASQALSLNVLPDGRSQAVQLVVFAVALAAIAVAGSATSTHIRQQRSALEAAQRDRNETKSLATRLLDDTAAAELIVTPSTGLILQANDAYEHLFGPVPQGNATVDEALSLDYPEALSRLLQANDDGELRAQTSTPAEAAMLVDIATCPVEFAGQEARRVRVRRTQAADLAVTGLDELGIGLSIVGPDEQIAFSSGAALTVFPAAIQGATAESVFDDRYGLSSRWWDIAPSIRSVVHFEHSDRRYTARIVRGGTALAVPLTFIRFEHNAEGAA